MSLIQTADRADVLPPGMIRKIIGASAPNGWLLCDGAEQACNSFERLFDAIVPNVDNIGLGTKVGDFTTDFGTDDKLDLVTHGFANGDIVHVASAGTIPAGLLVSTKYFVINQTANDFELSLTLGGSAVDITDDGTGTHSVYDMFQLPDMRGRLSMGLDDMGTGEGAAGLVTDAQADLIGGTLGAEDHPLITAELAAHTHSVAAAAVDISAGGAAQHPGNANTASGSAGSGTAHNNMQPTFALNVIIKT